MATPFSHIYERALFRFKAYDFIKMDRYDIEDVMRHYLNAAISDFSPVCLDDLSTFDEEETAFEADLDNECQEILAAGIAYHWLSAQILNQRLLRNAMSTKDYQYFSPANLLRESQDLRNQVRKEYRDRIVQYTYHHGAIADLTAT